MPFKQNADWLIIGNGPLVPKELLVKFSENRIIMALDGAVVPCIKENIVPDIVLGDFDSIDVSAVERLKEKYKINFIYSPDQNSTDLEKGLRYVANFNPHSVYVCQATGLRLDHSIHNLRLLRRVYSVVKNVTLLTDFEKAYFIKNKTVIISAENPEPMALLAFPKAVISSKGLKFDMDQLLLEFAERESTSNFLRERSARITIKGEALLILSFSTELVII